MRKEFCKQSMPKSINRPINCSTNHSINRMINKSLNTAIISIKQCKLTVLLVCAVSSVVAIPIPVNAASSSTNANDSTQHIKAFYQTLNQAPSQAQAADQVSSQAIHTVTRIEAADSHHNETEKNKEKNKTEQRKDLSASTKQRLLNTLQQAGIKQPIRSIEPSPLPSMYQVTLVGRDSPPLHITADGKYVLQGVLHSNPSPKVSTPPNEPTSATKSGMPVSPVLRASILNNSKMLKHLSPDVPLYYTAVPGVIWGTTLQGQPFITTKYADVFTDGEISVIEDGRFMGLDAEFEKQKNRYIFSQLDEKELIVYPATTKERAIVYVATDVNCPYCRVLHKEIANINAQGITLKVIGFPVYAESSEQMRRIWCETDERARKMALDVAMNGILQKGKSRCRHDQNPLYTNQVLAAGLAVFATPAIYRTDGVMYDRAYDQDAFLTFLGLKPL